METFSFECPLSTCGRRFEDPEKLQVHVSRRHPEYQQKDVSKKDNQSTSSDPDNNNSKGINNTVNTAAKTPSDDKKPPLLSSGILGRPPSASKNKTTSTMITSSAIKPCSPRVTPACSDNLRRSQELFKKSTENLQIVAEKTRGKSLDNQQESNIEVQEKMLQKSKELKEQQQKELKRQMSMQVDKELIESIMFELNRLNDSSKQKQLGQEGEKEGNNIRKESGKAEIAGVECGDEVMSEEEGDDQDSNNNINEKKSKESNSSQKITNNSLKPLVPGSSSAVSSLSSSLSSQQSSTTNNNLPSVQGILSSRAKLTRQFILSKSGNSCEQLDEIENLIITNEELLVFEDTPPNSHSSSLLCELIHLRSLSLSSNLLINIVSLREFCLSLVEVNLNFNNLTDLSPLSECMLLERISASHNKVCSINALAELPSLRVLMLFNNQLGNEDIKNLNGFKVLKELDLGQNPCSSQQGLGVQYRLQVLSQCKSLNVLDQQLVTPSEIVQAGNFKQGQSHNNVKQNHNNRPSTAPMQRVTSLSASVIVNSKNLNNQDKKPKPPQAAKETAEQSKSNALKDLENQLHSTQQNCAALREQIKQQKKQNKVTESELSELEKQNILFRDQAGQVEGINNTNKILLRKISAYESTLVLHQETPEELKNYLKTLSNQVQQMEEDIAEKQQRKQIEVQREQQLQQSMILKAKYQGDDDDENIEYGAEQLNELLMRSTAAFSQIKKDLKLLHNTGKYH